MSITLLGTEGYEEHLYVNAVERLAAAGYSGEFELLGIGMTGVVVLDPSTGVALKVARHGGADLESIADEYEFLVSLADSPVAAYLPQPVSWDPVGIMTRETIEGRPGGWGTKGLRDVYDAIVKEARARDWSHPEFKENSFIIREDGSIVMVDVGFANRLGMRFVAWVEAKLEGGFVPTAADVENFSFNLRMDASNGLLPQEVADAMQARLKALPVRQARNYGGRR